MKNWKQIVAFLGYPFLVISFSMIWFVIKAPGGDLTFAKFFKEIGYCYGVAFWCSPTIIWIALGTFMAVMWIRCFAGYSLKRFVLANLASFLFVILPIILVVTEIITYCGE